MKFCLKILQYSKDIAYDRSIRKTWSLRPKMIGTAAVHCSCEAYNYLRISGMVAENSIRDSSFQGFRGLHV